MRRGGGLLLLLVLALSACGGDGDGEQVTRPASTERPPATATTPERGAPERSPGGPRVETWTRGLEVPWEIGFLPDGRALVTERPGRVRLLERDGSLRPEPVAEVEVEAVGEGGLLGLAVDPGFARNRFVYLYRTTSRGNEVVRYRLEGERLREQQVVVQDIPAGPIHDGGRIRFGPDGDLYLSTGESGRGELAQNPDSLGGKFLVLPVEVARAGGGEPQVFSTGHRNAQGFDWQPRAGRLLATEHGPSGGDGPRGFDEVNLVRRGANYGWPEVFGSDHGAFAAPLKVYEEAIAPAGGSFVRLPGSSWTGDFLFGTLVGEHVRRLRLAGDRVALDQELFAGEFGRVRSIAEGPDGALYALTSNRDGRGSPRDGDDKVLRIVPPAG